MQKQYFPDFKGSPDIICFGCQNSDYNEQCIVHPKGCTINLVIRFGYRTVRMIKLDAVKNGPEYINRGLLSDPRFCDWNLEFLESNFPDAESPIDEVVIAHENATALDWMQRGMKKLPNLFESEKKKQRKTQRKLIGEQKVLKMAPGSVIRKSIEAVA